MSGRGKGEKGLGKGGAKRHRKVHCDNIQSIVSLAVAVSSVSPVSSTKKLVVSSRSFLGMSPGTRKTVAAMDVVYALKCQGKTLYEFGG
eukprot:scaffold127918_cov36-Cyclotella_meneghiniana.AAC.1